MSAEQEYLTKEKYDELKKELAFLKTVRRKEIAEHLEYAKSLGDLSENAEYHEAREEQANIENRIAALEALLQSAAIVELHHTEEVTVGSTVVLQKEGAREPFRYQIVGSSEADAAQGRLSLNSPLGQAMSGRKKGESFVVKAPGGEMRYTITDIE